MIPKIIHYIWLGGKPLPKIAEKCIKSWKKYCPDYEIKRWDESNLDLNKYSFAKDAYESKKYAFASDVLRTDILFSEGGVYFDIDVELLKPIDNLLEKSECIFGFETSNLLNPGLFCASVKGNKHLEQILKIYESTKFDVDKLIDLTVCEIYTAYFEKLGLRRDNTNQEIGNVVFYNSEYFGPKSLSDGKIRKTKNTVAIHHFIASWQTKSNKFKMKILQFIKRIIGQKTVNKLKAKRKKKNENTASSSK